MLLLSQKLFTPLQSINCIIVQEGAVPPTASLLGRKGVMLIRISGDADNDNSFLMYQYNSQLFHITLRKQEELDGTHFNRSNNSA